MQKIAEAAVEKSVPESLRATSLGPSRNMRVRARQQADQVYAFLERHIDQGRIRPGDRIATERELAEQFGASRSVVRSALAELHKAGKIVRRVGHGTVVQPPPAARSRPEPFTLLDTSPAELLDFRIALEPGLAEAIALNASDRDLKLILDCLDEGDGADGLEQWERCDRSFHLSLVAASHNRLAVGVYEAVIGIRHEWAWLKTKQGHTTATLWQGYQDDHRRIAALLVARDAARGAEAIRDHLCKVRSKMLGP